MEGYMIHLEWRP